MEMHTARLLQPAEGLPPGVAAATSRQAIADHLRQRTHGVDAPTAQQRTRAFYRLNGHRWSLALA
jgi:hypothetical protein